MKKFFKKIIRFFKKSDRNNWRNANHLLSKYSDIKGNIDWGAVKNEYIVSYDPVEGNSIGTVYVYNPNTKEIFRYEEIRNNKA